MNYTIRKAVLADIKTIHAMLLGAAAEGMLLPRSLSQLYAHCRDFFLVEFEGKVAGCCALSIVWDNLVEIRSLYVDESLRYKGFGRVLVEACLQEARELGANSAFTLTYKDDFFAKLGFAEVTKDVLPQKIWADCIHCPKFPDCDEIAMRRDI